MNSTTPRPHASFLRGTALVLLFCLAGLPCLAAPPPLALAFDDGAVVVSGLDTDSDLGTGSGLDPAGEIVYFSIRRSAPAYVPRTTRRTERFVDDDGDGEIRVELEGAVPPKFLAVAVELATGRFAVLTPEGSPARQVAFPAASLVAGPGNRLDRLEDDRDYVEILLVRPGAGVWHLMSGDGTPSDESPASDGVVRTSIESMLPIGDSGRPPSEYAQDDLLIRVAPREMEYYATRIVRPAP